MQQVSSMETESNAPFIKLCVRKNVHVHVCIHVLCMYVCMYIDGLDWVIVTIGTEGESWVPIKTCFKPHFWFSRPDCPNLVHGQASNSCLQIWLHIKWFVLFIVCMYLCICSVGVLCTCTFGHFLWQTFNARDFF